MGNKIGRTRQVVDKKYTRPQGLYQHRDIDHKKLRNLILDSKLAPCYPGEDDGCTTELEECPICFLFYPSLNRSKCCTKGLCTECFLQMKPTYTNRPSQCPFCKTSNYAVEYRGAKTKEEKGVEQAEEQRVIEAQIRMRQQELQNEKERMRDKEGSSSSSIIMTSAEFAYQDVSSASHSASCFRCSTQEDDVASSEGSCSGSMHAHPSHLRQNRDDNFDIELEDVMVMEAIWLSIQDQGIQRSPSENSCSNLPDFNWNATVQMNASPSCGLAHAAAALAEHQQLSGSSTTVTGNCAPDFSRLSCSANFPPNEERTLAHSHAVNSIEDLPENIRLQGEQSGLIVFELKSDEAETGTSYARFNNTINAEQAAEPLQGGSTAAGHVDGQRMLTMAAFLVEPRETERIYSQGVTWLQQLP